VTERLRVSAEIRSFDVNGRSVSVTASFGVVCSDDIEGEPTSERVLSAADRALYASKDAGRNCVHLSQRGQNVKLRPDHPALREPSES
jgi:GGDEF domain-containing protein